jgi:hypothetical protein
MREYELEGAGPDLARQPGGRAAPARRTASAPGASRTQDVPVERGDAI